MKNILGKTLVLLLSAVAIFFLTPTSLLADKPDTTVKPPKPEKPPKPPKPPKPDKPGKNNPPVADAGVDQSVIEGDPVTLDGSGSTDSDGIITDYEWKEGGVVLSEAVSFDKSDFSVGLHTITLMVTDNDRATASDSMTVTVAPPYPMVVSPLKTGQTQSYDQEGNEVIDGSLKDDGYYQKGVIPDYSRDDTAEIVTDNHRGLMWQDDAAAATVAKSWLNDANYGTCVANTTSAACYDTSGDTAATYCADLTLGSYSDWRVPTSKELEGIVDYGKGIAAIDTTYFHNINSNPSIYWSSTTYEYIKSRAWDIFFFYGGQANVPSKNLNYYIRCVRDGQ